MKRAKRRFFGSVASVASVAGAVALGLAIAPVAALGAEQSPAQMVQSEGTVARWYGPNMPGLPCPYFPVPGGPCSFL